MLSFLQKVALTVTVIGAVNWGLIGLFQFDLVAGLFGGEAAVISRIIYTIVGIAGLYSISVFTAHKRAPIATESKSTT